MRLIANLLIAISLAVGLVAASSAYLVDLSLEDEALVGLTLNERVLRLEPDGLTQVELGKKGTLLDAPLLAALRGAQIARVRVEEFAFGRWKERWYFLLTLFGLGAGALLVRQATAAALAREHLVGESGGRRAPAAELAAIAGIVEELLGAWDEVGLSRDPFEDRSARARDGRWVLERLSVAIEEHGPAFVAARELLVSRMGLGGYAALMDRFAAAERQLHRAWSSAADGVLEETGDCLGRARVMLEEARLALGSAGS